MADANPQKLSEPAQATAGSPAESDMSSNGKRKAESELEGSEDQAKKMRQSEDEVTVDGETEVVDTAMATEAPTADGEEAAPAISKNALKRLKRQEAYDAFKDVRKDKRKEKRHEKQAKKRAEKEAKIAEAVAAGLDPATAIENPKPWTPFPVPVTFVIDCDFEQYMREPEIVSLSSQITRSYSQNRRATYQANLWITSFGGKLKTRFDTAMKGAHKNWKGAYFAADDFMATVDMVKEYMRGEVIDVIRPNPDGKKSLILDTKAPTAPDAEGPEPELADDVDQSVVYLTSESPYTLERLEANTIYVIGGIVDRNREKGLCYNRAKEKKVRTARLPIGEFMAMQSRYVLTTNQVVEIMAKWLECGNWGEAFLNIIPKRKGGVLKPDGGIKPQESDDGEENPDDGGENPDDSIKLQDSNINDCEGDL